jgi:hypothetical protein
MKLAYNVLRPEIPKPAKIFGWILVIAGCFFAYVYMVSPGSFFPGVAINSYSEQFGLYSTGVRILGSVLGIVLALVLNSSALLALMLATRVFIELGDVIVGLVINNGVPDTNTATLTILAAVEIFFIVLLARHINNTSARQVA